MSKISDGLHIGENASPPPFEVGKSAVSKFWDVIKGNGWPLVKINLLTLLFFLPLSASPYCCRYGRKVSSVRSFCSAVFGKYRHRLARCHRRRGGRRGTRFFGVRSPLAVHRAYDTRRSDRSFGCVLRFETLGSRRRKTDGQSLFQGNSEKLVAFFADVRFRRACDIRAVLFDSVLFGDDGFAHCLENHGNNFVRALACHNAAYGAFRKHAVRVV